MQGFYEWKLEKIYWKSETDREKEKRWRWEKSQRARRDIILVPDVALAVVVLAVMVVVRW